MASFNDKGRGEGTKRRPGDPRRRRMSILAMERLEVRRLLSGGNGTANPNWHPTDTNLLDAHNGPMANLGPYAVQAYSDYLNYVAEGAKGTFTTSVSTGFRTYGTDIELDVEGYGNFTTFEQEMVADGFGITATDPSLTMIEGWLPIADLPKVAEASQTVDGTPVPIPVTRQQGASPDQADIAMNVATARTAYGVNGAGQKLGVLSDSVNEATDVAGNPPAGTGAAASGVGLAGSVASGDLPPNVQVIQDLPAVDGAPGTDEGRAMLEQIYDLAPAAQLAFATGGTGDVGFADNIEALAAAGATTIVDDIGYADEPYYQDGVIQQAVDSVVAGGATYLSAAGNAADSGYESQFRGVTANVAGLGSGTYMNFNPNGGTNTELGINVYSEGGVTFQFDQPFYTTNGVVSNVEFDILDQAGNLVFQGNANNIAMQQPIQMDPDLPVGVYNVVIKVDSGPNPGHVVFYATGDNGFAVDHTYGSAGGTYYPSAFGHSAQANTISVGAVPFWGTPAYTHTPATDTNEPFSSFGPELIEFTPTGTPLTSPQLLLKPDVSSTDGNNTSFFAPGNAIDTTTASQDFPANPTYNGQPATTFADPNTPTNDSVTLANGTILNNFTGTSSAAPNLAAIVALMKEKNPTLTQSNIVENLITTTTPLDGQTPGVWNAQAGYGLVNAFAALSAVQSLNVKSIVPGGNTTVTTPPTFLTVTFNQPVNIATLTAANLLVIGPNGATVTVGAPIGVDSPTDPSVVVFPISILAAPGQSGNGVYRDAIIGPNITSESGTKLASPYADQFNLEDTNGPRVLLTTYFGRIVTLAFNEALNPTTVTQQNIFLFRDGGVNNPNLGPEAVIVSDLPGASFTYNPTNFTVTINLTGVPQVDLPTDHYGLVVSNAVTDLLNNPLNGAFSGVFPSGTTPEGLGGSVFFQDLGIVTLQAPIISALALATSSDTGIVGDDNTADNTPSIDGQVTATFPGTVSGLLVYAEFNGISHTGVPTGGLDLAVGSSGRGYVGHYDVQAITNLTGGFVINYPPGVTPLPDGLNQVRVVVVGAPDSPPLPGLSSQQTTSFRVDTTDPVIGAPASGGPATSIVDGEQINSLSSLVLNFVDPVNPQAIGSPFAVPATFNVPALDPITADNVSSYGLFMVNASGQILKDESSFITTATFASTSARVLTSDPYTGSVTLTFAPGLPQGTYDFLARSSAYGAGLSDAAGNPFVGGTYGTANFLINFVLQPTPTYITSYTAYTPDSSTAGGLDTSGPRAYYEIPVSGVTPRAEAPPTLFTIDFSNSLPVNNSSGQPIDYANDVELVGSGINSAGLPTGNFGDLGITNTEGFTTITGLTVILTNSVPGAVAGQYGYDNRLLIELPAGFSLPANYYRVYLPNTGTQAITDVFGNQLDGEFLGYQNAQGVYVDQLPDGTIRGTAAEPDLSGDGNPGGAFMTGFAVVPNGNIIYADADAIYNPLIPAETPNGSQARPYPVLAPEAVPTAANGGNLNSPVNAGTNFNPTYDRSGDGVFEPSAFFAAQEQLNINGGPVVVVAEASVPTYDPTTGTIIQKPFVLQAPSPTGNNVATIANDASAAIPALTTLVFQSGSILKMQNAALLIQNQGSALQIDGGPNSYQSVIVTSYKDNSVGGVTNGNPNSTPGPGDYGGIVFRNFSQAPVPTVGVARSDLFPGQIPITGNALEDDRLKGQFTNLANPDSQADAVSGADDIMSSITFLTERYAGGVVPQTIGTQYDGITLLNSRPAIVNSTIADSGTPGSAVAGISVDVDSLREDDVAQGPLLRNDSFVNNGLNGIYIRANVGTGVAEPTDAIAYPTNPTADGGSANYVFDDPYPYLLTSKMEIGQQYQVENGSSTNTTDRLYITPGMIVKFETGAWLEIGQQNLDPEGPNGGAGTAASLVVGDPTYIKEYDNNNLINPSDPGFVANSPNLPKVIFTTFDDNAATTTYTNPYTGVMTTIVAALPTLPTSAVTPPPEKGTWGGIQLDAGSRDTINSAIFEYGGGFVNTAAGASTLHAIEINPGDDEGSYVMITNNTFLDNADVPINTAPNVWLAGNEEEPLNSGAPFIHGNIFTGNDYNGVGVTGGTTGTNQANVLANSTWTGGDFTYFLRDTIVVGPSGGGVPATPSATTLETTPTPNVTMTLQSTLAGTVLADGTVVPAPGVPLVIKLLNVGSVPPAEALGTMTGANDETSVEQGAGFVVGIDNNVDPTGDELIDPGAFSDLRIVGIGANQTTGQARVPVIITSAYDDTVGTTVNGVVQDQLIPGNTKAPSPGDGGVIYFGGNSLTSYNLTDPRYGSIIDNADISYITRIEQQGGGIIYTFSLTGTNAFTPSYQTLFGLPQGGGVNFADQYNAPKQITISNSNFNDFSSAGFYAHPDLGSAILIAVDYTHTPIIYRGSNYNGEPTHDYFYNDTFSNMPTGVYILSQSGADVLQGGGGPWPTPAEAVFLNDDFYNDAVGVHSNGQGAANMSSVSLLVMDSIIDGSTTSAIVTDGKNNGGIQNSGQNLVVLQLPGQFVYDDFWNDAATVTGTGLVLNVAGQPAGLSVPFDVDPGFRDPGDLNFFLLPTSQVIDVARSELGPSIFGDMLYPMVNYPLNADGTINLAGAPIRNEPTLIVGGNGLLELDQTKPAGDILYTGGVYQIGMSYPTAGGPFSAPYYSDIVMLPGRTYTGSATGSVSQINYPDQWYPVLQSSGLGTVGNTASAATFAYAPIVGQRDQVGDLRQKDPNSSNIGYGSKPYFDLGAFEYIVQNPPVVDAVAVNTAEGNKSIYVAGGIGGTNQLPTSIQVLFNEPISPATANGMSVLLYVSGDGVFDDPNDPTDKTINLTGLISFGDNDELMTINTTSIFTSILTASDEYRLVLKGTGSSVIRDDSGLALDGYNIDPKTGLQLPLPSGSDDFPGSDFQVTFDIKTQPPAIVAGTFELAPSSDSSMGLNITNVALPTFTGTVTDVFPPVNFLQGLTVYIDLSTDGTGVFNDIDAGVGTTNAQGQFTITLTTPVPNTPNTVGTNGIQEGPGSSLTLARVRIVDSSGNQSNLVTDPLTSFIADGALTGFQEDRVDPKVAAFSPTANTVVQPNANGEVVFSTTFTKNMKTSTLNANNVLVYRTGGSGNFTNPVQVPIVPGSFTYSYSTNPATLGYETVTWAIAGNQPNDEYEFVLKGTGATPITDLAANPLDGKNIGMGSDFTSGPFAIYNSNNSQLIYVGPTTDITAVGSTQGTRENPFPTIAAAMNAAVIGDVVLVLPGTYREDVTMKAGVRLLSAAVTSTDTSWTAGSPYQTLIYGVVNNASGVSASGNNITTVYITGSIFGIPTEVSGFAIISPLIGNSNTGTIDSTDVAVRAFNTNAVIDRNIVVNAGIGIYLTTAGIQAPTATVFDNIVAGNINGIGVYDYGATQSIQSPAMVVNNTILDNTTGLFNIASTYNQTQAYVINNIFFANHDLTTQRKGTGISSNQPNTLAVGNNLFYQNGPTNSAASNATGTFIGFNPANLSTTPDVFGNLIGNPFFVQAEDPRPNADTPASFFSYSDFDLTSRSVAINAADQGVAPPSDFLYRTPVFVSGHGFPGTGPASIGAFYYDGVSGPSGGTGTTFTGVTSTTGTTGTTGGTTSSTGSTSASSPASLFGGGSTGGSNAPTVSAESVTNGPSGISSPIGGGLPLGTSQFSVVNTSLPDTTPAGSTGVTTVSGPGYIDINFSDDINPSSVNATDLVLSGSGLSATNPAHSTSYAWIDDHAIRFYLSGAYNNTGTLTASIAQGALTDTAGASLTPFSDTIQLGTVQAATQPTTTASPVATTPTVTPTTLVSNVLPVVQPVAAPAPVANAPAATLPTPAAPTKPSPKLTAKELKAEKAAEAKAQKAAQAAQAAEAKAQKAAEAKAAKAAKAASKKAK